MLTLVFGIGFPSSATAKSLKSQKVLCAWSTANLWFHQHITPKAAVGAKNSWPPLSSEQDLDTAAELFHTQFKTPTECKDGKMQTLF